MVMSPSQCLDATFAALADPTRRAILARLTRGDASVTELAEPFEMSLPAISKHLKVLEHAGLITRGRDAQWRPCRIEAARLKEVSDWLDHFIASFNAAIATKVAPPEGRLLSLLQSLQGNCPEYLRELQKKEKKNARSKRKK